MAVAVPYQNAARYRQTQAATATKVQLVIMLYDGAIRFLSQALEKMASRELEPRHNCMIRAQRIIAELMGSLDMEQGGEIAANLQRIYIFMLNSLAMANHEDSSDPVRAVIAELRALRESWAEVDRMEKQAAVSVRVDG
jgi:flagellar protein FliS